MPAYGARLARTTGVIPRLPYASERRQPRRCHDGTWAQRKFKGVFGATLSKAWGLFPILRALVSIATRRSSGVSVISLRREWLAESAQNSGESLVGARGSGRPIRHGKPAARWIGPSHRGPFPLSGHLAWRTAWANFPAEEHSAFPPS